MLLNPNFQLIKYKFYIFVLNQMHGNNMQIKQFNFHTIKVFRIVSKIFRIQHKILLETVF